MSQPEPLLVTVDTAARMLGIGRSKMYELLADGTVASVKLGEHIRRVPVAALRAYIASLMPTSPSDSDAA